MVGVFKSSLGNVFFYTPVHMTRYRSFKTFPCRNYCRNYRLRLRHLTVAIENAEISNIFQNYQIGR